ncbi:hypothetical protein CAL7716_106960 (plasmid) [Calothrix sp. PCC 7716]|nr:hypothetical protein CAL7716_106960 [Calothrix sp. PCC 7716]
MNKCLFIVLNLLFLVKLKAMLKVYVWKENLLKNDVGHASMRICNLPQNETWQNLEDLTYLSFSGDDLFKCPRKFNTYNNDVNWHKNNHNKIKEDFEIFIDINELFYDNIYSYLKNGGYHFKYDIVNRNCASTVISILSTAINSFWKYEFKDETKYGFWHDRDILDIQTREALFQEYFYKYNNISESYIQHFEILEEILYRASSLLCGTRVSKNPISYPANIWKTWKPSDALRFANFSKALVESNKNKESNIYDYECLQLKMGATKWGFKWF